MRVLATCLCLALAGCGTTYAVPENAAPRTAQTLPASAVGGTRRDAGDFSRVRGRVEPVVEQFCREEMGANAGRNCDFDIRFESDRRAPPNAFQTIGKDGRPLLVLTARLLDQMRTDDEIAFVMAHESGHHIAGHLAKQRAGQVFGGLVLGAIASAAGDGSEASRRVVRDAMDIGAAVGGRVYSQTYELEADWLGAFMAARAGFDPERGARVFGRPALSNSGGPVILSSHPASPRRLALVREAAAEISRQRAAGLIPRPAHAR